MTDTGLNGHAVPVQADKSMPEPKAAGEGACTAPAPKARTAVSADEAAEVLGIQRHVLKFWEKRFPLDRKGNPRNYKPEDLDFLFGIKALLHGQGCTVSDVQRGLKQCGADTVRKIGRGELQTLPGMDAPAPAQQDLLALASDPGRDDPFTSLPFFKGMEKDAGKSDKPSDRKVSMNATPPSDATEGLSTEKRAKLESILETLVEMRGMLADVRYAENRLGSSKAAKVTDVTKAVPPLIPLVEPKVAD